MVSMHRLEGEYGETVGLICSSNSGLSCNHEMM